MKGLRLGVAAAGVLLVAGVAWFYFVQRSDTVSASGADPDDPELVALGRQVYAEACADCHGANLEGEANWRVRNADGTLKAPPHDASGHTWHHDDDLLFRYTKLGGAGVLPPHVVSAMPAFGDAYTDKEIWAVLAFIKSRWPQHIRARQQLINRRAPSAKPDR